MPLSTSGIRTQTIHLTRQDGCPGFTSFKPLNRIVMFSQASVIMSTGGGGVSVRHPRADTPRQTPPWAAIPPADGYYCGRYASYWNAFLSLVAFH